MSEQERLKANQIQYEQEDAIHAIRAENARLRSNLVNCAARLEAYYGEDYPAVRDAKAALQPERGKP